MTPQTRVGPGAGRGADLTRRAAIGLGVGVVVTGCSLNNPFSEERTPAAEAVRDLSPDVAVAVQAATLVRTAQAAVDDTLARHPALAARLAGLLAAHRAHLAAVVDAVPDGVDTSPGTATPSVVPARPAAALSRLVAAEQGLHGGLVGLALRAESGAFARLLGAMAASLSQQLHRLAA